MCSSSQQACAAVPPAAKGQEHSKRHHNMGWHPAVLLVKQRGHQHRTAAKCLAATGTQASEFGTLCCSTDSPRETATQGKVLTPSRRTAAVPFQCRTEPQMHNSHSQQATSKRAKYGSTWCQCICSLHINSTFSRALLAYQMALAFPLHDRGRSKRKHLSPSQGLTCTTSIGKQGAGN